MKLNDELIVTIIDEDNIGNGIAKINDFVIFIKNTLLNEKVKIKITKVNKNYAIGEIINIIEQSKYRINIICP